MKTWPHCSELLPMDPADLVVFSPLFFLELPNANLPPAERADPALNFPKKKMALVIPPDWSLTKLYQAYRHRKLNDTRAKDPKFSIHELYFSVLNCALVPEGTSKMYKKRLG